MQQRVVIAMALATDPALLILDEPTTGLDATVEAEVLDLVAGLQAELAHVGALHQPQPRRDRARCATASACSTPAGSSRRATAETVLQRSAPPVHGRPAALHPARRRAQGPRPARHDSRASCRTSARSCPAACSPTAARSPTTLCHTEEPDAPRPRRRRTRAAATSTSAPRRCRARRPPSSTLPAIDRGADAAAALRRPRQDVQAARATTSTRSSASRPRSGRARRSASSASRAAARRRSPARCSGIVEPDVGRGRARRARARAARSAKRSTRRPARAADRLPEPGLGAQPPPPGAPDPLPVAEKLAGMTGAGAETRLLELMRSVRLAERYAERAARASSRAASSSGVAIARAFAGDPAARRLRRADLGARRVGAGGDPEPARRAAGRARASPTSSSRTTSASCATSPTGSPCSTSAG